MLACTRATTHDGTASVFGVCAVFDSVGSGMPIYTYQCPKCGARFERRQRIQDLDRAVVRCTHNGCTGTPHRVIGLRAVVFRGPGFYKTAHGR